MAEVTGSRWYFGHADEESARITFSSSLQLPGQQLVHQLRISLPFGPFHHLAHEESEHGFLAGTVLLKLLWIGGKHVVDNFIEGGGVR
jgi:hypothetical protein